MEWSRPGVAPGADNNPTIPSLHVDEFREILAEVINEQLSLRDVAIARRWSGGTLVLKPSDAGLKSKEIPVEAFFHKIVMVRDRLRVMEQKINAHRGLDDAAKVELQQYITRIYGSLTTFNFLFRDEAEHFVGSGSRDDDERG